MTSDTSSQDPTARTPTSQEQEADFDQDDADLSTAKDDAQSKQAPQPDRQTVGEGPPLPADTPPPLPNEAPPIQTEDDGWAPLWDDNAQAYYFYNRFTNATQWENPRMPEVPQLGPPGVGDYHRLGTPPGTKPILPVAGGYDPAVHGDYDPNADYAQVTQSGDSVDALGDHAAGLDPAQAYAATGTFNRFTGRWQAADLNPEKFNDENKSRRQMNAFFDVDAAANSHDGKSLKAERSGKKLSKQELKAFKEKRREKKEEKRRAWLRD